MASTLPRIEAVRFFFVWGYVKDSVFVPPLPVDLPELRARIINAFQQINRDMLRGVRDELDYRLDTCRITRKEHMEQLLHLKNW